MRKRMAGPGHSRDSFPAMSARKASGGRAPFAYAMRLARNADIDRTVGYSKKSVTSR